MAHSNVEDILDSILQDRGYMQQTTDGRAFCVAEVNDLEDDCNIVVSLSEGRPIRAPPDDAETTVPVVGGSDREPATHRQQQQEERQQQQEWQQQARQQQQAQEHGEATGSPPANETRVSQRLISRWDQVKEGLFVYMKYYGLWHAVLVTNVCPNKSKIKAIHYAWPGLLKSRIVQEEWFVVNPAKGDLWVVELPREQCVSPAEAIAKARARVGQTGFNMFTQRSSHLVQQCLRK